MGKCMYCNENAGFLRKHHKQCKLNNQIGKQLVHDIICEVIKSGNNFEECEKTIKEISEKNYVNDSDIKQTFTNAFDRSVNLFLEDGILSDVEENNIVKFKNYFKLDQDILDKNGSFQKIFKASILKELLNGSIPKPKLDIIGNIPFMLQKSEHMIYLYSSIDYYENRYRTQYQGSSHGISIKIAKGVYYKTSSFKGNPVRIDQTLFIGRGMMLFTNKHIYFSSGNKNFKIPYNKIISVIPFTDGVGIQKDTGNAKPILFKGLDGWFIYNLIINLNKF